MICFFIEWPTCPPISHILISRIQREFFTEIYAVAAAYGLRRVRAEALPKLKGGFSAKKDLLAQLLALSREVAAKIERGAPVMPPGMPQNYPDVKKLVTEDCIRRSLRWGA
jgi:hypothetical protein